MSVRALIRPALLILGAVAIGAGPGTAQSFRTVTASRLSTGEESLEVELRFGVGQVTLVPATGRTLYHAELHYLEDKFRPITDYDAQDRVLRVGVETLRGGFKLGGIKTPQQLDLALSPHVPLELTAELGAAEAELELGGLSLRSAEVKAGAAHATLGFSRPNRIPCRELDIKTGAAEFRTVTLGNSRCAELVFRGGAGDITLDFTGEWSGLTRMAADVKLTFGALRLRLPRKVGVSIEMSRFFASFDQGGFTKRGSRYVSDGYDGATVTLDLTIKAVVGDIDVEWVGR